MEQGNHNGVALIPQVQNESTTDMKKEELKLSVAHMDEEDHQKAWKIRADVLYHFFAYRYFDQSSTRLDLLNFTDADIDSFNLTATRTRGFDNWYMLATYMQNLSTPTPETNTHRRRFIYHVRAYNATQAPHFRFYLCNLTADDIRFLESLRQKEDGAANGKGREAKLIWATSCVEEEARVGDKGIEVGDGKVDHVGVAVEKCVQEYRKKEADRAQAIVAQIQKEISGNLENVQGDLSKQVDQLGLVDRKEAK